MIKFNEKYNHEEFLKFISDFLPTDFLEKEGDIIIKKGRYKEIKQAKVLGICESLDLYVLEMDHDHENDPRITIATDAFKILADYWIHQALVIFKSKNSDNYRLSYLTISLDLNEKNKVIKKYSNAHRYSFYLGPNAKVNTPNKYLIKQGKVKDIGDLKTRFSLEVVNKEFYKEIAECFTKLVGGTRGEGKNKKVYEAQLKLPSIKDHSQTSLEFAVRLIGRIIFCWFLREKTSEAGISLMPKELLSIEAVNNYDNYYHTVLEPVFFEVLNKKINRRGESSEEYSSTPYSYIPYLNGGLFSPQEEVDFYKRRRDEQSIYQNTLVVPDSWITDLFDILETYHFTIDENTSYDEELSIDPEMLGRIFENLLAEINPETGESARKSTGSYYTPRPIVDYMVDESLLLYLKQKTNIDEDKLRAVISYDLLDDLQNPLDDEEKQKITDALEKVKILDPACGSGAFPIGALQKIVFILQQTDPQGKLWFEKQIKNTSPEFRKVLEREFENKNFDYIRKTGVIRENIYGIDIQPIATEISRLRCFLTLIVDQQIDDSVENRGIVPLPNLDFKFVTANSLIGLPEKQDAGQLEMYDDMSIINELKNIIDEYFECDTSERETLKSEFYRLQNKLKDQLLQQYLYMGKQKAELTQTLSSWDPFSHHASSWFDTEWMFGVKDGFDIVIANPPYVDSETMVKKQQELREKYKSLYVTAQGNWDLYIPFLELGEILLNKDGIACFITPNKWYAIGYGKEIRKFLVNHLIKIGNCSNIKVFDAGNSPVITLFGKNNITKDVTVDVFNDKQSIFESLNIQTHYLKDNFGIALATSLSTILQIRNQERNISDYYIAENPCSVSEAYEITKLLLESSDNDSDNKYFKFANTGTIDPYLCLWGIKDTTYLKSKYNRPIVDKTIFKQTFPRRYEQFSKQKIIISGMRHFESFLDEEGKYIAGKSTEILIKRTDISLKIALGILNSKLIKFYINQIYNVLGIDGGINFTTELIENLPIPLIKNNEQLKPFIDVVDEILILIKSVGLVKNTNVQEKINEYKAQIDHMVYKLYGLTDEEIKIVENN